MRKTFRVVTSDKYSFLNFGKETEHHFRQLEFIGKHLFTGKEQADLETESVRDIITQADIFNSKELQNKTYQKLHFVIGCLKKRCKDLHYEIFQTAHGEILMYFIAGQCLVNLAELDTYMADFMVFSSTNSGECSSDDESFKDYPQATHVMDVDYIQCLRNSLSQVA